MVFFVCTVSRATKEACDHGQAHPQARKRSSLKARNSDSPTSWDPVATWYKKWVGKEGSDYHRKLAIPAVVELLDLKPNETLLDIGCGTGILSRYLPKQVNYTGIDASPRLIAYARSIHGKAGLFLEGDARRLQQVDGMKAAKPTQLFFCLAFKTWDPWTRSSPARRGPSRRRDASSS